MLVGAKVCDLTEDLLWFLCGNFDVFPKLHGKETNIVIYNQYASYHYIILHLFSSLIHNFQQIIHL